MIEVRQTRASDASAIVDVQRRAFRDAPDVKLWHEDELQHHTKLYPEGQFVAVDPDRNDLVVGSCTTMRVSKELALKRHTWREVTGGSKLPNHHHDAPILYGVDVSVRPAQRNRGVGRKLYEARSALLASSDCEGFAAGGRLPNYQHFADKFDCKTYVDYVQRKLINDPVLSFQLKNGMRVLDVMPDYLTDANSLNWASLIYLPHPRFEPPRARPRPRARNSAPVPAPDLRSAVRRA